MSKPSGESISDVRIRRPAIGVRYSAEDRRSLLGLAREAAISDATARASNAYKEIQREVAHGIRSERGNPPSYLFSGRFCALRTRAIGLLHYIAGINGGRRRVAKKFDKWVNFTMCQWHIAKTIAGERAARKMPLIQGGEPT